jgi:glucose-6-phosphate isomerase
METRLPDAEAAAVAAALEAWTRGDGTRRLQGGDAGLWTDSDEARWLGWLHAPETQAPELAHYRTLADGIREDGVRHALLLGMGGSSLCCEVLARTFGSGPRCPVLEVVDSTVPAQIRAVDARIDPRRSICFVSSKSGSTIETDVLRRHFFERIGDPQRFIAITDPGRSAPPKRAGARWPTASPRSAGASRPSRRSDCCRRRCWGSTWTTCWAGRGAWPASRIPPWSSA